MTSKSATLPSKPSEILNRDLKGQAVHTRTDLTLDSGDELAVAVLHDDAVYEIRLLTNATGPLLLHWGAMKRRTASWKFPEEVIQPEGTTAFDAVAAQTPFVEAGGLLSLTWTLPADQAPKFIGFVLHGEEPDRWLKHHGKNLSLEVAVSADEANPLDDLVDAIVGGEMGKHGWTLMHRFNLCHDLIDDAGSSRDAWALLFVWLRYSALRQLDWQRNYNTKPRELSHAQDRLTGRLATAYIEQPGNRDIIRQMLACLGRGGDGQRVRDEILHIMHRHHIKEVGGTWMEQWHQKLHNNTTPDDVVICEAFLAFLHANGDVAQYDATLKAGGVTDERLASLERPINTKPEWHPHLKDGLLHDFGEYLVLLKSVHSGTDLSTAINAGAHLLGNDTRETLYWARSHFEDPNTSIIDLVKGTTWARHQIQQQLADEANAGTVKELLYLDLALEQTIRTIVERASLPDLDGDQLIELIEAAAHNLNADKPDEEINQCLLEWMRLPKEERFSPEWALHAKAALDRLRRAVESDIDDDYQLLQPKAEWLGKEIEADKWVVTLFSEELVRGRSVFLLSMLIHHFDPVLRRQAKLGDWQVISPSNAIGKVQEVESLRTIQGKSFKQPTIIIAEKVYGDEEPPEGVTAVITPSSVDLVSHVAVRARNNSLLFATCYERKTFDHLKAESGKVLSLKVSPTGDVLLEEATATKRAKAKSAKATKQAKIKTAKPSLDVLPMPEFKKTRVGGKSWHLKELDAKMADWIHTPRSVALPFGVFDAVLKNPANKAVAKRYKALLKEVPDAPEAKLAEVRATMMELEIPVELQADIDAAMESVGLTPPDDKALAATRIKEVWGSKWNDRAYFSRQARGFPHDAVQMAVLIQEVVAAEFAFVIHTVNPFNGNPDEIYAEVVLGLGETLVGNYPGRAMSFVCPKGGGKPTVLAYPGKSTGLFGGGLIYRSDSNAEDLAGYAGAGLYDSVLLEEPEELTLDYTEQALVWDEAFREEMLVKIAQLGEEVEQAFGSAQDIEGAYGDGKFSIVQTRPQVGL